MPPRLPLPSSGKPKPIRFSHFESNRRGKLEKVKRKRNGNVKDSQTVRIEVGDGSTLPAANVAPSLAQAFIDFTDDFTDDAGDEIFEHQTEEPVEPSKMVSSWVSLH